MRQVYDEKADAKADVTAALARAKAENRRVLVVWGGNWCGWCVKLADVFAKDKDVAKELQYEYDVVKIDIGQFDKHMELAATYAAEFKASGVPYLTVLDGNGKVLANQETGSPFGTFLKKAGTSEADGALLLERLAAYKAEVEQKKAPAH